VEFLANYNALNQKVSIGLLTVTIAENCAFN